MRIRVVVFGVLLGILGFALGKRGGEEWLNRVLFAEFVLTFALVALALYFVARSKRLTSQIRAREAR